MAMIHLSPRRLVLIVLALALVGGATAGIVATVALDSALEEYAAALFAGRVPGTPGGGTRRAADADDALTTVGAVGEASVATVTQATLDSRLSGSWVTAHDALGYGVVVSADGWVLLHADTVSGIANPMRNTEVWIGGTRYVPTQVVTDTLSDTALMKVDASGLAPVAFAASEGEAPGARVYAPSTQGGLLVTTVADTRVPVDTVVRAEAYAYGWELAVHPQTGTPVFDGSGTLLGLAGEGGMTPVHQVSSFVKDVIRDGAPSHAGLGAYVADLGAVLNMDEGLRGGETYGALVIAPPSGAAAVLRSSPAATAGLLAGDIIGAVDGVRVDTATTLAELLRLYDPGETAAFAVTRGGEEFTLTVTFVEYGDLLY